MSDAPPPGPFSGDQPPSEQPPGAPLPGASQWQPEGYGYAVNPAAKNNGLAVASLVCGIVGLLILTIVLSPLAIIFGVRARGQIARAGGAQKGQGLATAGMVLGIVGVALIVILIAFSSSNGVTP